MCDFFLELLCSLGELLAMSLVRPVSVVSTLSYRSQSAHQHPFGDLITEKAKSHLKNRPRSWGVNSLR